MREAKREGFTFYKSFIEAVLEAYDDPARQNAFISKIVFYGIYEEIPVFNERIDKALFNLIKPNIDSSIRQYDQKKLARDKKAEKRIDSPEKAQNSGNEIQNSGTDSQKSVSSSQSLYSNTNTNSISTTIENSISTTDNNSGSKGNAKGLDLYKGLPTPLVDALRDFEDMRNQMKRPINNKARETILKKLHEYSNGDLTTMIDIINQSIVNCWKDIYPLKEIKQQTRKDRLSVEDMQKLKGTLLKK